LAFSFFQIETARSPRIIVYNQVWWGFSLAFGVRKQIKKGFKDGRSKRARQRNNLQNEPIRVPCDHSESTQRSWRRPFRSIAIDETKPVASIGRTKIDETKPSPATAGPENRQPNHSLRRPDKISGLCRAA
jgi:hypothetical protein